MFKSHPELSKLNTAAFNSGRVLPVMEHFHSLQGEGYHTGAAAYFFRIGGCDVGCHWCDVKESWNAATHPLVDVDKLIEEVNIPKHTGIVITGGEPLMYNLNYFTSQLKLRGYTLHLETSGAYALNGNCDWICVSPKKNKPPLPEMLKKAHELKVIIHNQNDFEWAKQHAQCVSSECKLYLQPEWSKLKEIQMDVISFVQHNPIWKISLQTHKYLNIP